MQIIDAVLIGGGPIDGFPMKTNSETTVLEIPYNEEMLAIIGMPDSQEKLDAWRNFRPLGSTDAKAVAVYVREADVAPAFDENTGGYIGIPRITFRFREVRLV